MALTAFSAVNVRLPEPTQSMDRSSLGSASAVDATGVEVDLSAHSACQLQFVPTSDADLTIGISVTADGTNYVAYESITVSAGAAPFVKWYTGWEGIKVTCSAFAAGSVTIRAKRYPWWMAMNFNPVSVGI